MTGGSFTWNGTRFVSTSNGPFELSPAYVVAKVAKDALWNGRPIDVPEGYSAKTLMDVCWILGVCGTPQHVSFRQAAELASIGAASLAADETEPFLLPDKRRAIADLAAAVRSQS